MLADGGRMGRITTHILDTTHGCPAAGVAIRLISVGEVREQVASAVSNADGRTEKPLLEDAAKGPVTLPKGPVTFELASKVTGTFELEFDIGDYFRGRNAAMDDPAFLDTVVIRFAVKADENYHVPLLCSPWAYSTYRGS
jgi:5-hydroxyisourate hydrolase